LRNIEKVEAKLVPKISVGIRNIEKKLIEAEVLPPNKKVVYTAITGDYEDLKTPLHYTSGWDYICFTDDPNLKSDFWQIRYCEEKALAEIGALRTDNPRRLSSFFKMKPHLLLPSYDESLWVDGSFYIIGNIDEYVGMYLKDADMLCIVHPQRDCIYDEAAVCIACGRTLKGETDRQMAKYREAGMSEHLGLIASGLLYRKHTDKVAELNNLWYDETMTGTPHDQLEFNYCCYKLNFKYDACPLNCYNTPYFRYQPHKGRVRVLTANLRIETQRFHFPKQTVLKAVLGYPDNVFDVRFTFKRPYTDIKRLCFAPGKNPAEISIDNAVLTDCKGNAFSLVCAGSNASDRIDGFDIFNHNDPNIYFIFPESCTEQPREVRIEGRLRERMRINGQ
jgi:hypothetical protein